MKKKIIIPIAVFLIIVSAVVFLYKRLIVWEEDSDVVFKENIETQVAAIPENEDKPSAPSDKKESLGIIVKGRIAVTVTKERGDLYKDALVTLKNSSGTKIRESKASQSGMVVFDEIPKGVYTVEASKEGDGRNVSKKVSLGEGEKTSIVLSVMLDQEVKVAIHLKKSDGSSFANQTFTLTKIGGLDLTVSTNSEGTFTASITPDDNWLLKKEGVEIAKFRVAPTGEDQTINVQSTGS